MTWFYKQTYQIIFCCFIAGIFYNSHHVLILSLDDAGNFISDGAIPPVMDVHSKDVISFSKVDIVTPTQKMLARELTCDIRLGGSLLVTGSYTYFIFPFRRGNSLVIGV